MVYLFAFWSLAQQLPGLIGHDGILPAADYLRDFREWADTTGVGLDRYRLLPTLCWLATDDRFLQGLAIAGAVLAALLAAGMAPLLLLPLLWVLYLSLTVVGGDFLSFQWDALLLEAGLLAIAIAPPVWLDRWRNASDPPWVGRWLMWWLLIRLMLASGVVKLASGDSTWRDLSALSFHYETQPLPTPIAWYVSHLPLWWHRVSAVAMFAIELGAPCLAICGRRPRRVAAALLIGLQVMIAATGNYGFFNLLTIALAVLLLDDEAFAPVMRMRTVPSRAWRPWLAAALAAATLPVSVSIFAGQVGVSVPGALDSGRSLVEPFRSINRYGLFAVMTTTRPEIVVEGSMDGISWQTYEFRHKPGALTKAPTWVAPLHPRLDWQMWFVALSRFEDELWFQQFCRRLLEGSASVRALLATDPFPTQPPRYVRATLYQYRFAAAGSSGASPVVWWTREIVGPYGPTLTAVTH